MKIVVHPYAMTTHTPTRGRSHFVGAWSELIDLVEANMKNAKPAFKEGTLKVPVPARRFYTALVKLTPGIKLVAEYKERSPGEQPAIAVAALEGDKVPAKYVDVVVYSAAVLRADGEQVPEDVDYMIITILARLDEEDPPPHPITMERNQHARPGGTHIIYDAGMWAKSVAYHMVDGYVQLVDREK